ncbi:MAG: GTPase Era [Calditrichaeota bacterium]|nr:GTPase Era [Calditrichota bacterium]RQW07436.1 MAG: GTPase Era [Calditrichota bacterium]
MQESKNSRSGYVALAGRPNVGKSTLMNALLDFKLSIVTAKPQTTRKKILGILNGENFQIIFIDTPGIIKPGYSLQNVFMQYVNEALEDADVICLMSDVSAGSPAVHPDLLTYRRISKPLIMVLNKIDLIEKGRLLPIIDEFRKKFPRASIVPVSAIRRDGIGEIIQEIVSYLPEHPPYFPQDYLSDQNERFFVSEIIREKIFQLYSKEVPYACHVEIEEFIEQKDRKDVIRAVIYVDQPSQKGILIGKQGQALKKVGESARKDIETFLDRPVYLELYVKVLKNWRKKLSKLRSLGF